MIKSNHISVDIVTKGMLDTSIITKGILIPFVYEIITPTVRRRGGGMYYGEMVDNIKKDIKEIVEKDDGDYIKIYVNWDKKIDKNKKIQVKLLKKEIMAVIEKNEGKKINIKIENFKD
jgi:hypothetical protein